MRNVHGVWKRLSGGDLTLKQREESERTPGFQIWAVELRNSFHLGGG